MGLKISSSPISANKPEFQTTRPDRSPCHLLRISGPSVRFLKDRLLTFPSQLLINVIITLRPFHSFPRKRITLPLQIPSFSSPFSVA
jgi:hypothetical protein